jgi:hypothetical protein
MRPRPTQPRTPKLTPLVDTLLATRMVAFAIGVGVARGCVPCSSELGAEAAEKSYEAHLARRAEKEAATGKPIRGRRPTPGSATHKSRRQANLTDPDSRLLKTKDGYVQGYNAQAVATTDQFVIAAEVTNIAVDAPAYAPIVTAAKKNLKAAGEQRRVRRVVADAGYWSVDNVAMKGVESFIAPGRARQLKKIAESEETRIAILDRVAAGEVDTLEASEQLGSASWRRAGRVEDRELIRRTPARWRYRRRPRCGLPRPRRSSGPS